MKNKIEKSKPSIDRWLKEAKGGPQALEEGMYLIHIGTVRESPRDKVRKGIDDGSKVKAMDFSYDKDKVEKAISKTYEMPGIFNIKVWLNEGRLKIGENIMYILIGGDIRPNVIDGLEFLVEKIKTECVSEKEVKVF